MFTFAVLAIGNVIITATIDVFHFAISVIRASRTVTVAPVIVSFATVVFAGGIVATTTSWWRQRAATRRTLATSRWTSTRLITA